MSVPNFNAYPSVNEQALEVSNELHDELHLIIDQIRMDIMPQGGCAGVRGTDSSGAAHAAEYAG